ncbi:glycosyltransferase [Ornithinibacillus californiensis]|uniref:glycosyltransferase n=1 Tax=Ornithinibacillus californiensis TaxID=161536 RepID=UPI00064E0F3C|nr:glycosyltransferase [Ornithinibacillus californiensis]
MKNMLIASYDLEVGGVERSLISMLQSFDYERYAVDLMLYHHHGDFMNLLTEKVNLLPEVPIYSTVRKSVSTTIKEGHILIGMTRLLAKVRAELRGRQMNLAEPGYYQMQLMWRYSLPFLPKLKKQYDIAISYLWPHYFVAEKVDAKTKIAWIHTDYGTVEADPNLDLDMWKRFDYIVAVSESCKESFLQRYEQLRDRVIVVENILFPDTIRELAETEEINPMLEDNRFKIITVARLSHAKGIDLAVQAMRQLIEKGYTDIAWYVVGYGGDEGKLKEMIASRNLEEHFFLLGKRTNPYPYIKAADLYVQPSRYEGKAVTVGEAQILSKPVLITNYPTAGSQVRDGDDGLICELSVDGIVDGIERLYHDALLRNNLASNCASSQYNNGEELRKLYQLV